MYETSCHTKDIKKLGTCKHSYLQRHDVMCIDVRVQQRDLSPFLFRVLIHTCFLNLKCRQCCNNFVYALTVAPGMKPSEMLERQQFVNHSGSKLILHK